MGASPGVMLSEFPEIRLVAGLRLLEAIAPLPFWDFNESFGSACISLCWESFLLCF
jgi:hypothetical protein